MGCSCARTLAMSRMVGLILSVGLSLPAVAGPQPSAGAVRSGVINLRTGDVVTAELPNLLQALPQERFTRPQRHVVQLDGPITPARRTALLAAEVKLGDYLPTDAFIADLSGTTPATLKRLGFIAWVGTYRPEWRIDPRIGTTVLHSGERQALAARGELALTLYLFEGEPLAPALAAVSQLAGAEVVAADYLAGQPLLNVLIPARSLPALAGIPSVQYVEEYPEFTYRNTTERWIVQSNIPNVTPLYDNGIQGEGQVLGHIDGQVAVDHCSFYDPINPIGPLHRKILAYNEPLGYSLHGTHTAGTGVGDAGAWDDTRGVAHLAKLVHNGIPGLSEAQMFSRLDLHRQQGATVHTNSWGNDGTTAYDGLCRAIDDFSWQYDDNLICFAVTNTSTLRNPENAKDLLAVGASGDAPNQANLCSGGTGPTADGRRKPEIFAPGCSISSSSGSSGCATRQLTGTSMACPAIAGTALLARQYFTAGYYPTGVASPADAFTPSGALLKAVLLNSAVDMTGISGYPSDQEGWGRVLADGTLYFPGDARKLIVYDARNNTPAGLTTGGTVSYDFAVDDSEQQLRVTLVWHDAPAAVNASYTPVNDLNLVVTSRAGTSYKGNVFSGGASVPGGSADASNNVEQVHVNSPGVGMWTVAVSGAAVNTGVQGYALVVTGAVFQVVCPSVTAPPATHTAHVGQPTVFSVTATGTMPLSYQWRKDGVDLSDGGSISGATTATLTINPVALSDAGNYDVLVANACGSVTSPAAALWAAGDMNCDGAIDFADINPFVLALGGQAGYEAQYPNCVWLNADCNDDGTVNFADINPFVALLSGP